MAGKKTPANLKAGDRFIPYGVFETGVYIPNVLLATDLISSADKVLWGRLSQFAGENGACFPSLSALAIETGLSRSGVIKSLNSLIEKGFLEKRVPDATALGRQCTNRYYFLMHPIFLKALSPPSTQSVLGSAPSTQNQLALVHSVDQPGSQSRPKEIHKENQKKTTTTTIPLHGISSSMEGDGGCSGFSLSDEKTLYIELKVKHAVAEGEIRKSPERYKLSLLRRATQNQLDMSDFEELVRWSQQGQDVELEKPTRENIQQKKSHLHDELQRLSSESREWWEPLSRDHPAKREIRPRFVSEDIWIRTQFKKYGNEQGAINDIIRSKS